MPTVIDAVKDAKKLKFHSLTLKHLQAHRSITWQMCSVSSVPVYKTTDGASNLLISFWNGIISSPLDFSLGMGFDAIFIKTSTWKWTSYCEEPFWTNVTAPCQVMTYAGQLLKKLILLILFAMLMYCLGKRGGQQFFFKLVIICRGPWAKHSAHTWEQNSGLDGDHGDISTSPDCALPIEMQTCAETASLSFFVFVILSLARQIYFFPFFHCQHCFSSELYYPVTSEEAKLHMSAWQESSTDGKFVTSCIFLLFSPWVMKYPQFREIYHGVSLDGNHALSNGAPVASVLEGRNQWSSSKSFPMSSGNIAPELIACIYG